VDGITRSLAKQLGPRNIRVNSINPGVVETEGTHAGGIIGNEFERQAAQQTPLGRIGQPADIAAVAVFLASDDARWVTAKLCSHRAACRADYVIGRPASRSRNRTFSIAVRRRLPISIVWLSGGLAVRHGGS
jgi:NAD(P)-dependent dehydrogenase (short-subunit alcohol dehydrogenase family)